MEGQRHYVRRRFADHSRWSLILLMPDSRIYASRFLGIIITLLVSIMMMIYLYGTERLMRDRIELESRLNLADVARNLQLQATTDPLTGLFNRLKFNDALGSELARAKRHRAPLSLMLYDVDHFKDINDSHGHQVGDAVLTEISQWVLQRIRPSDLLARWGGEEFIILAPGSDGAMAYQAAERLRTAMHQVAFASVGTLSCSFGVSSYRDGDTAATMLAARMRRCTGPRSADAIGWNWQREAALRLEVGVAVELVLVEALQRLALGHRSAGLRAPPVRNRGSAPGTVRRRRIPCIPAPGWRCRP